MNRPLLNRLLIILTCIGVCIYYVYPPQEKITLGLDLRGGTSYTLQLDLSGVESSQRAQAVQKAIEILRKRVDGFGVSEPILHPVGTDRVVVEIPGLKDEKKNSARSQLERAAYLEFRMVHPESAMELTKMKSQNLPPPLGYEVLKLEKEKDEDASEGSHEMLVKIRPELTGKNLVKAVPMHDPSGYLVSFELNSEGGAIFEKLTSKLMSDHPGEINSSKRLLGIVLDKKLISAPAIQAIIGSRGQITGNFDYQEAFNLANALENPLETPVKIIEERRVDPTLGSDSVKSGFRAGIIGLAGVVFFMLVYYLRAGLIANLALMVNIILLFGVLVMFHFTLTLPGVAGIILTVGIAVDANVLIYERIREELRKGKSLISAIDAGYDRAFGTIIDANVTTLITALVLSWLGSGPVKGFGLTLSIGIVTSVFCAVYVSRFIIDLDLRFSKFEKLSMLSFIRETKVDFLGYRWPAICLSCVLVIAGAMVAMKKGNEIYGVDFTGGDSISLKFSQKVGVSEIRSALEGEGIKDSFIQYQKDLQGETEMLLIKVPFEMGLKAEEILGQKFPGANFSEVKMDKVGGVVGSELQWTALKGLGVAAFCILLYVSARFEFGFAVGAVVALLHDVLICLAFFFFTDRQLSLPAIGALLTIAGYSLNDTIVVFDRIREEVRLNTNKLSFMNLINQSVNATLSRTLLTSLTTFIAALALYVFGGGVINDFAFILLVGVITGTYSSVFIASPVLLLWNPTRLAPQIKSQPVQ